MLATRLAALMIGFILTASGACADTGDARARIVYLTVTSESLTTGAQVGSTGTGFFVSRDGYILTTEHIFDDIREKDGDPEKIVITAHVGSHDGTEFIAKYVSDAASVDLVLLRAIVPFGMTLPEPFRMGDTASLRANPPRLFTAGFAGRRWLPRDGAVITDADKEVPYAWALGLKTYLGQSGSPVYLEDGATVVGVVKGTPDGIDDYTLMIPIEYAMPLIGHIKIAEMAERMAALEKAIPRMRSGRIAPGEWKFDGQGGLVATVRTDLSSYRTPAIYLSITGTSSHGTTYKPTAYPFNDAAQGFQVYVYRGTNAADDLLEKARNYEWAVDWIVMESGHGNDGFIAPMQ